MSSFSSDCCGASPWLGNPDLGRCGHCKEVCEFIDDNDND